LKAAARHACETMGQTVELPHHNRVTLACKDGGLQFLEGVALQGLVALSRSSKPLHRFQPLTPLKPGLQLGTLAVGLLALGGGDADVGSGGHASWSIPYFTQDPTSPKPALTRV
jgi:hypothetical protein